MTLMFVYLQKAIALILFNYTIIVDKFINVTFLNYLLSNGPSHIKFVWIGFNYLSLNYHSSEGLYGAFNPQMHRILSPVYFIIFEKKKVYFIISVKLRPTRGFTNETVCILFEKWLVIHVQIGYLISHSMLTKILRIILSIYLRTRSN